MLLKWYVLRIKPHKERSVFKQLENLDIEIFYPTIEVKPKNPRSAKEKPYFPGYMFVKTDIVAIGLNTFSWIPGTRGLVSFGDVPAIVPEELINKLWVQIEEANKIQQARLDVKQGELVRIISGPLAGYNAIFDRHLAGNKRVQLLLAFLSQHPQTINMNEADIEKVKSVG